MLRIRWMPLALSATLAAALALPGEAGAQASPVKVTLETGGKAQTFSGSGVCRHEPRGYIYGRAAALWMVEANSPKLTLSYWHPAAGGAADEFSLDVRSGRTAHRINTVRGSKVAGTGQGSFRSSGMGGRFELTGKAEDGTPIHATIECGRFGAIMAEGG